MKCRDFECSNVTLYLNNLGKNIPNAWTSFGTGGGLVNDISTAVTSWSNSSNPVDIFYTSTGSKDIQILSNTYFDTPFWTTP